MPNYKGFHFIDSCDLSRYYICSYTSNSSTVPPGLYAAAFQPAESFARNLRKPNDGGRSQRAIRRFPYLRRDLAFISEGSGLAMLPYQMPGWKAETSGIT
jgi:hypothetical protein